MREERADTWRRMSQADGIGRAKAPEVGVCLVKPGVGVGREV